MKKVGKYIISSLLGILFSIPIVTFADSVTAMHFANFKIAEDADTNVVSEFFKSFKLNLRQSISFLPAYFIPGGLIVYGWINALKPFPDISFLFIGLLFVVTLIYLNFFTVSSYLFSKFSNTTGRLITITIYTSVQKIDVITKYSILEFIMLFVPAIIICVNRNVVGCVIGAVVFLVVMVLFEALVSKAMLPIFEFLLRQEKRDEPEKVEE